MEAKRAPGFEGQAGSGYVEAEARRSSWGMGTENAASGNFFLIGQVELLEVLE